MQNISEFLKQAEIKGIGRFEGKDYGKSEYLRRIFMDALPPLTPDNIGLPYGLLNQVMEQSVRILVQARTAEEVMGPKKKMMDWEMETASYALKEVTGSTSPYSDFGQPNYVGFNATFIPINNYRFYSGILIGDLISSQYSRAKIEYISELNIGAAESLAIDFNRFAFQGYFGQQQIIYGILNHPSLTPYVTIANSWNGATFDQIKTDISTILSQLVTQSGGNVDITKDRIKIAIPAGKLVYLKMATTEMGIFLINAIKEAFPNLEFVGSPELTGAYTGNKDVLIAIAINNKGGVEESGVLGFSELGKMSRIAMKENSYTQTMSSGSCGFNPYKPTYIVRAQGI